LRQGIELCFRGKIEIFPLEGCDPSELRFQNGKVNKMEKIKNNMVMKEKMIDVFLKNGMEVVGRYG